MPRNQERFSRAAKSGALAIVLSLAGASITRAGLVEVSVTGIAQARGHVRVELCTRTTFLTRDCPYQGNAPAMLGATLVQISNVAPGEYAAQAFHDETDEGVVHQNAFGIPRERIGFSNDAPLRVQGPRFHDAAFSVGGEIRRITLKVSHLFGR